MLYIKNVEIRNFKSIKDIEFSAKKVNVFMFHLNIVEFKRRKNNHSCDSNGSFI